MKVAVDLVDMIARLRTAGSPLSAPSTIGGGGGAVSARAFPLALVAHVERIFALTPRMARPRRPACSTSIQRLAQVRERSARERCVRWRARGARGRARTARCARAALARTRGAASAAPRRARQRSRRRAAWAVGGSGRGRYRRGHGRRTFRRHACAHGRRGLVSARAAEAIAALPFGGHVGAEKIADASACARGGGASDARTLVRARARLAGRRRARGGRRRRGRERRVVRGDDDDGGAGANAAMRCGLVLFVLSPMTWMTVTRRMATRRMATRRTAAAVAITPSSTAAAALPRRRAGLRSLRAARTAAPSWRRARRGAATARPSAAAAAKREGGGWESRGTPVLPALFPDTAAAFAAGRAHAAAVDGRLWRCNAIAARRRLWRRCGRSRLLPAS